MDISYFIKPFIFFSRKFIESRIFETIIDFVYIWSNRIYWILKKERDYIIDKRKTINVIFCNGNFILVNEYHLFPLKDGSITLKKGFNTSNSKYTDFNKFMKVDNNFNCEKYNRFKNYIIKIEKLNNFEGLIKIVDLTKTKENVEFDIFIENAKKWKKIIFILLISIPNEFKNRENFNDEISFKEPKQYGIFELIIKADKHKKIEEKFAPLLLDENNKEIKEKIKNRFSPFYYTKIWKIRKPSTKKLIIKHLKGD